VRGRGINYDTGAFPAGKATRPDFDPDVVRREMRVIARDLHCTAVRITGGDPDRLTVAGECAAAAGLEVWFAPFPCEMTADEMLPLLIDCADRAEDLRRGGAQVVLVTGAELSVFGTGFLPGEDLFGRIAVLGSPTPERSAALVGLPGRMNAYLRRVVGAVRPRFSGRVTYASLPIERVDWGPFDIVGVDAYRERRNADGYREELRRHGAHGKPLAVTEFGCCTFRGAAELGARGWLIVDRDARPKRLDADYVRDEAEQAAYLRDMLEVFAQEGSTARSGSPSPATPTPITARRAVRAATTSISPRTEWSGSSAPEWGPRTPICRGSRRPRSAHSPRSTAARSRFVRIIPEGDSRCAIFCRTTRTAGRGWPGWTTATT
jgi:hypothetical protein